MFDKYDDTSRGFTATGGQLNIYDDTLNKYVFFIPLTSLPSVVGSTSTVEHNVTTSETVGKIKDKRSIDDKDVEFLYHRDNIARLNKFLGKKNRFMVVYPDFTGWKFTSEYVYKPNDADSKVTGTITFISSDVDTQATLDVRDLIAKTVFVTSELPSEETIGLTNGTVSYTLQSNESSVTYEAESNNSAITTNVSSDKLTISTTSPTATSGIVTIRAKKEGMQSYDKSIAIVVK